MDPQVAAKNAKNTAVKDLSVCLCIVKVSVYDLRLSRAERYKAAATLRAADSFCLPSNQQLQHQRMKGGRRLLSLVVLPTITETLEDSVHLSSSHSAHSTQSLEEYMASIQALAHPTEAPNCGPARLQRSPRLRHFSKVQMKLSASLPRGSSRTLRTSRASSLALTSRDRDCRGKDPVDWLFGQIRT
ncbi:hypothetical protein LDENG_00082000 [Lucifuga dentata]|nr:hypothetical protein LDENG_00082000 [Lucifuga dentata]